MSYTRGPIIHMNIQYIIDGNIFFIELYGIEMNLLHRPTLIILSMYKGTMAPMQSLFSMGIQVMQRARAPRVQKDFDDQES